MAVRSLRTRLLALWLMLATSAGVTGYLLLEFYQQSANAQVSRAEDAVARGCRDIGDRYAFFVTGWTGAAAGDIDDALKRQLTEVVQAALQCGPYQTSMTSQLSFQLVPDFSFIDAPPKRQAQAR